MLGLVSINLVICHSAAFKQPNAVSPTKTSETLTVRKRLQSFLSLSILIFTLSHAMLVLPATIIHTLFFDALIANMDNRFVLLLTHCLMFTFHSIKFLILLLFNSKFKREFKRFCLCVYTKTLRFKKSFLNSNESNESNN